MAKTSNNLLFVFLLLLASLVLTNLHFQSIYILSIVLFIAFFVTQPDAVLSSSTLRFASVLAVFFVLYAIYYFVIIGAGERFVNDLSKVYILLALLLAFIAGSFAGVMLDDKLVLLSRTLLICMSLIAIAFVIFDLHALDADGNRKLLTHYPYNRNHLDDLYLFQAFLASQAVAIIVYFNRLRWFDLVPSGILVGLYTTLFFATESFGGLVGFFAGLAFTLTAIIIASGRWLIPAVSVASIILILFGMTGSPFGDSVVHRANSMLKQFTEISVAQIQDYDNDFRDRCEVLDPISVPVLPDVRKNNPNVDYGIVVKRDDKQIAYSNPYVIDRSDYNNTAFLDATMLTRLVLWRDAIRIWMNRPLLGHVEFNPEKLVAEYDNINSCNIKYFAHVHNFYLDILVRGGILLLLVYLSFVVIFYSQLLKNFAWWRKPILFALPLFFTTYLVIENLFDMTFIWRGAMEGNLINFALVCGLVTGAHQKQREFKIMDRLEKAIRGALAKQKAPDFEARSRIYKAAVQTLEKLPTDEQDSYRTRLFEVIKSVEGEYSSGNGDKQSEDEYVSAENLTFYSDVEPNVEEEASGQARRSRNGTNLLNLVSVFLVVFVLGAAATFYLIDWNSASTADTASDAGSGQEVSSDNTGSEPKLATVEDVKILFDASFPGDLGKVAQNAAGLSRVDDPFAKYVNQSGLVINENVTIYGKDLIPVDTSKVYLLRLNLRVAELKSQMPRVQAGFATYDKDETLQRAAPGTHRYFAHIGRLNTGSIPASGDRIIISGVITGEGNASHDMFRFGSRYARPAVIMSFDENSSTLKIESLEVLELN